MIKYTFIFLLLFTPCIVKCQRAIYAETPIQTVSRILNAFKKQDDNIEILENREAMEKALYALQQNVDAKDFGILIDTWLDYNPPNFHTRKLVEPILQKNTVAAIEKINEKLIYKQTYERQNSSPGADLIMLREKLYKSTK